MSFLATVIDRVSALFAKPEMNAAQAWQEGGLRPQHAFWMYAAPVSMILGRDSFFLPDPAPLQLTEHESQAFIASLNQHFAEDGYHFYLLGDSWFLGLDAHPNITTTHVNQVVNHDIADYLPKGEGALAWAKLQNEIQMLLFDHPINQHREKQNQPAINSVWCYGLGVTA